MVYRYHWYPLNQLVHKSLLIVTSNKSENVELSIYNIFENNVKKAFTVTEKLKQ